jgi:hypothetical protein
VRVRVQLLLLFQVPLVRPFSRLCAAMKAAGDEALLLKDSGVASGNLSLCVGLVLLLANDADIYSTSSYIGTEDSYYKLEQIMYSDFC